MVIPHLIRKPTQSLTDCFTISTFCSLELKLERGQAAFPLAVFAIKISNVNSLKINVDYVQGFSESCTRLQSITYKASVNHTRGFSESYTRLQ